LKALTFDSINDKNFESDNFSKALTIANGNLEVSMA
jgi:hypothetical protein